MFKDQVKATQIYAVAKLRQNIDAHKLSFKRTAQGFAQRSIQLNVQLNIQLD